MKKISVQLDKTTEKCLEELKEWYNKDYIDGMTTTEIVKYALYCLHDWESPPQECVICTRERLDEIYKKRMQMIQNREK